MIKLLNKQGKNTLSEQLKVIFLLKTILQMFVFQYQA